METKTFADYSQDENTNIEVNKSIIDNMKRWKKGFNYAISQFSNIDIAKQKLVSIKEKNLYNLSSVISKFEKNFRNNGGNLFIVSGTKEVIEIINKIIKSERAKKILLTKSSTIEELGIRESLTKKIEEVTYTNIAEHIGKINNAKASHMNSPLVEYNIDEILEIINKKYDLGDKILTNEGITQFISEKINEKIEEADMVITGANAIVAETGSIFVVENEGNIFKSFCNTKNQIIIAGIDKLFGQMKDIDILFPILSTYSLGQKTATYGTFITPTKDKGKNLFVILVNNNRTELLENSDMKEILRCIKCGACANVCPVYKIVGGYAYENAYPGPYGLVASPYLESTKAFKHLPYTSTLCGKCSEICPVNINIHNLIINTRHEIIEKEIHSLSDEKIIKKIYNKSLKRRKMNGFNYTFKNIGLKKLFKKPWGTQKELPQLVKNSFSKQYTDNQTEETE